MIEDDVGTINNQTNTCIFSGNGLPGVQMASTYGVPSPTSAGNSVTAAQIPAAHGQQAALAAAHSAALAQQQPTAAAAAQGVMAVPYPPNAAAAAAAAAVQQFQVNGTPTTIAL